MVTVTEGDERICKKVKLITMKSALKSGHEFKSHVRQIQGETFTL